MKLYCGLPSGVQLHLDGAMDDMRVELKHGINDRVPDEFGKAWLDIHRDGDHVHPLIADGMVHEVRPEPKKAKKAEEPKED